MDELRLAERIELAELKAHYFRYMDTKQWALLREVFTDDLVFYGDILHETTEAEPTASSADEWVEFVSSLLGNAVTVHQGHMPELRFADEHNAYGIWTMNSLVTWVDSGGREGAPSSPGHAGTSTQRFGHYHEHYRKGDDGKWRIKEIRLVPLRLDYTAAAGTVVPPKNEPWTRPNAGAALP